MKGYIIKFLFIFINQVKCLKCKIVSVCGHKKKVKKTVMESFKYSSQ